MKLTTKQRSNNWQYRNVRCLEESLAYEYLRQAKKIIEEGGTPFKLSDKYFFSVIFLPRQIEKGVKNHNAKPKDLINRWEFYKNLPDHKPYTWDRISHKSICQKAIHTVKHLSDYECIAKLRNIKTEY